MSMTNYGFGPWNRFPRVLDPLIAVLPLCFGP